MGAETEQDDAADLEGGSDALIETISNQVTVLVSHLQVMGGFAMSMDVDWPSIFGSFCVAFSFLYLDVTQLFALGCIADTNYYGKLMITFFIPTLALPLLFLSAFVF